MRPTLTLPLLAAVGLLSFSGCSVPSAAYRKVDTASPEFRAAVATEQTRLESAGHSPADAEKLARRQVSTTTVQNEKERRTREVAPLVDALTDLERPRGCWAFTMTTSARHDGHVSTTVERYDPFQPEELLWTLVTRDGLAPDAAAQTAYRRKKLGESKRWRMFSKRPAPERARRSALFADFVVATPDAHTRTFAFDRATLPVGLDQLGGRQETFTLDQADGRLLSHRSASRAPSKLAGGTVTVDHHESSIDYVRIDPTLPPFPSRTTQSYRHRKFGSDSGEIAIETTYTDYRRVKCYDDRFEVKIGLPSVQDLDSGKP